MNHLEKLKKAIYTLSKYQVANLSGGKDSVAMVLKLIEERWPLTHIIFFDGGMEFESLYKVVEQIEKLANKRGICFVRIQPKCSFLVQMLLKPVNEGKENEHYGYDWCGGCTRWRTSDKVNEIQKFLNSLDGTWYQYIGIAADEPDRIVYENNKIYPLVEWNMTEAECLNYCFDNNVHWLENDLELYSILKRVSCWCCKNKNLTELRNIYHYLPYYWGLLKGLQSRIDRPFYKDKSIFELEIRFKEEDRKKEENSQMEMIFNTKNEWYNVA